jgi:hypothetical protein
MVPMTRGRLRLGVNADGCESEHESMLALVTVDGLVQVGDELSATRQL